MKMLSFCEDAIGISRERYLLRNSHTFILIQSPLKKKKKKVSAVKKNTFESVLMRWMKLEPIIQSKVSQKEKHQYSILTYIYGI